ncbi:hypothetical protein Pta02_55460 [Planobispora takensis]|uniref:Uncharacterized protein n=1 Tax=Planobispora takensis TaxID=1367882 RepID=A0A8J3T0I3_9ACTN|nr:hypothetical protein Pta02_55460 [Planobispora takensis]
MIGVGAVIVLALTGLTGCSPPADETFVPADRPAGTPSAAAPDVSSSPSGSPSPAGSPLRPESVRVAPGVRVTVEPPASADPATAEMIAAFRDYYAGSLRVVAAGENGPAQGDTAYLGLLGEDAVRQDYAWVSGYRDRHRALRGTTRLYGFEAEPLERGVRLNVCVDMSRTRTVDTRTGRTVPGRDEWMRRPFLHAADMWEDGDGVRRIQYLRHALYPSERAERCIR